MTAVRRHALLLAAVLVVAGCGDSLATRPGPSRPVTTTQVRATTPFCEAVQASREAAQPVSGIGIGLGRQVGDIERLAADVRRANEQVTALAPQEIRADFERANQVVERQLELLEANGGDTLAVARDPQLAQERTDPAYQAASQRINAYVRSNCAA